MTYTIRYKLKGQWFWRKVTGVEGHYVLNTVETIKNSQGQSSTRDIPTWEVLALKDKSQVWLPIGTSMRFSKELFYKRHAGMEKEAGQKIPIRGDE